MHVSMRSILTTAKTWIFLQCTAICWSNFTNNWKLSSVPTITMEITQFFLTSQTFLTDFIGVELISSSQGPAPKWLTFPLASFASVLCFARHLRLFCKQLMRRSLSYDSKPAKAPLFFPLAQKKRRQENSYVKGVKLAWELLFVLSTEESTVK